MENFYRIEQFGDAAKIYIYGDITEEATPTSNEVSANTFGGALNSLHNTGRIDLYINSSGGSVFEGLAIYNQIKRHPAYFTGHVDGMAASIASVILMACDEVVMPANAYLMVHNPWTVSQGNKNDLRKDADDLDRIGEAAIKAYLDHSGDKLTRERIVELMDKETWLLADDAFDLGLCDAVENPTKVKSSINVKNLQQKYKNVPTDLVEQKKERVVTMEKTKRSREQLGAERGSYGDAVISLEEKLTEVLTGENPSETIVDALTTQLAEKKAKRDETIALIKAYDAKAGENFQMQQKKNDSKQLKNNFINSENGQSIKMLHKEEKLFSAEQQSDEVNNTNLGKLVKGMITGRWDNAINEQKIVSMNTNGDGNVLIPTPLSNQLIDMVRAQSVLNQAGMFTIPMDSSTLTVAKQTKDIATNWKVESAQITEGEPSFSPVKFTAKTLVGMCRVSIEMLEDAQNIGQLISNSLVQSLALNLDYAGILGTGTDPMPLGLYNREGITKQTVGAALENYKSISEAVTTILSANGKANSIIMNPRTYGELDNLVDTLGQPLNAPQSYAGLANKLITTQIPTDQGEEKTDSFAIVGDFSKLWMGLRTNVVLEVSRQASDVFGTLEYAVRAYLRADFQTVHDPHFVILDGIK